MILGYQMYVGVIEIVVFLLGAVVLGFFIHFFISSRRSMSMTSATLEPSVLAETAIADNDEWRIKYYEETETKQQLITKLQQEVEELRENEELMNIEVEELRKEIKRLEEQGPTPVAPTLTEPVVSKPDNYLAQLKSAQESLLEHNQYISRLADQIERLKVAEEEFAETTAANAELKLQVIELQGKLAEKENEIRENQQQQLLAKEMEDRLAKTYDEFNVMREKLQRLEQYLSQPKNREFEYEELQQNYVNLSKDFDDIKEKYHSLLEENQRVSRLIADTEDKLRESNFQRQQLLKKINFLEELNTDLQQISEQNKKLENQLKRMSEIELLLARVAAGKTTGESDKRAEETGNDY